MASVFLKNLGCKVNNFDAQVLLKQFEAKGFALCGDAETADIAVLNSCSVTTNAEKEARYLARRIKRENPHSMVVVTGCYAQTDSAGLMSLNEVDYVVPNEVKDKAAELIGDRFERQRRDPNASLEKIAVGTRAVSANRQSHFKSSLQLFDDQDLDHSKRARVNLKIQDGCNGFCSYCIIPYARGQSRSVATNDIIQKLELLETEGVQEVVLTGIHLGDYGEDLDGGESLAALLRRMVRSSYRGRIRLSSLEPAEVRDDLVACLEELKERICPHFHLPMQSGSDRILKLMRRTYNAAQYLGACETLRRIFPKLCLGADVIPGFPSEDENDFAATVQLVKSAKINYLHVFPYSVRPNTLAQKLAGHVGTETIKARAAILRKLSAEHRRRYIESFFGRTVDVIWEHDTDASGRRLGHSGEYVRVATSASVKPRSRSEAIIRGFLSQDTVLATVDQQRTTNERSRVV